VLFRIVRMHGLCAPFSARREGNDDGLCAPVKKIAISVDLVIALFLLYFDSLYFSFKFYEL